MDHRIRQRDRIMPTLNPGSGQINYRRPLKPASASQSAPDLNIRSSFKKPLAINHQTSSRKYPVVGQSKSATSIPIHDEGFGYGRGGFTIPNFGHKKLVKNDDPKLPTAEQMIKQVLQATNSTFSQGLKIPQLLDVIFCSYEKLPKTQATEAELKKTLEILVAKGIISRSFGSAISDSTYLMTPSLSQNRNIHDEMNLAVVGKGIKPVSHHVAKGNGGLPSGSDFPTRVARNVGNFNNGIKTKIRGDINPTPKPQSNLGFRSRPPPSMAFGEKSKLSKSFALRVGEMEALRPMEYIPNSPVSRNRSFDDENFSTSEGNWNVSKECMSEYSFGSTTEPAWEDPEEEQSAALAERFRAYARAIDLDCDRDDSSSSAVISLQQ